MSEFPRVQIPGHLLPATYRVSAWQAEAYVEYVDNIQPIIHEWVTRRLLIEDNLRLLFLIPLLAANPWWLHIVARSPIWRRIAARTD